MKQSTCIVLLVLISISIINSTTALPSPQNQLTQKINEESYPDEYIIKMREFQTQQETEEPHQIIRERRQSFPQQTTTFSQFQSQSQPPRINLNLPPPPQPPKQNFGLSGTYGSGTGGFVRGDYSQQLWQGKSGTRLDGNAYYQRNINVPGPKQDFGGGVKLTIPFGG